jgi:trk system potassium uptake protein TrkH
MNLLFVQRTLGQLLVLFSLTMLPPLGVSLYYQDGCWQTWLEALFGVLIVGVLVWFPVRKWKRELRLRDGFLIVALFWVILGFAGAVPLLLAERPTMTFTDAVFESVSGFTTTGISVLSGLDTLPKSILYYRQQIQWLGGLGMIVLGVAVLPMLGIGGMQVMRAETPGAVKDAKLKPRLAQSTKVLWFVYVAMTVVCAACFTLAGMKPFDAIGHAFSTLSTGGFSTHDASLGYYNNTAINTIALIFMFLGGVNFALHFYALRFGRPLDYFRDPEFRVYFALILLVTLVATVFLTLESSGDPISVAFGNALFHVVSIQSNTGFMNVDHSYWPGALPIILVLMSFVSGCAGSTSGGMKVIRWMLIWKQGAREVQRLIHPNAEIPVKVGQKPVEWRVIDAVWGFFAVYVVLFGVLMVVLIALGADQVTAFEAIASCMNNIGPALGEVSLAFASFADPAKWLCIVAMLLGRLEVFPLLVLVTPTFWRR